MVEFLLDANVLIALAVVEHEHHDAAEDWFTTVDSAWLCPAVEGALLRFLLRVGETSATAAALLHEFHAHPRIGFTPDTLSYGEVVVDDVLGHRQLTDVYLAAVAESRGWKLATFDQGLHRLRPAQTRLIGDRHR